MSTVFGRTVASMNSAAGGADLDVQTSRQVLLPTVLLGFLGREPLSSAPAEAQSIEAEVAEPRRPRHEAAALKLTRAAGPTEMSSAILPERLLLSWHCGRRRFRRLNARARQEYRSRRRGGMEDDGMGELSRGHREPLRGRAAAKYAGISQLPTRQACESGWTSRTTDD
jgi:hypothetical protein